jgi:Tol biopolymer transport system component
VNGRPDIPTKRGDRHERHAPIPAAHATRPDAIRDRDGFNPAEIWVMDSDGSNARRLTSLDARVFGLAWTPDGILSFSQEDGDAFNSYEIDLQTGQISTVTAGYMPVWLDDHTVIVSR